MKSVALCLVLLISANAFTSDIFAKHQIPNRNIMEVMVQVEEKLNSGSPFETINNLLAQFKQSVTSEQIAHDDLYGRQKNECDSEIAFRQGQIQDASKILTASTGQLNIATQQRNKANAELGITADQLTMNQQHLTIIAEVRKVEQETFSRFAVYFQDAIKAIDDAAYTSKKFSVGDASLVELADHTGTLMSHAVSLGKTGHYAAVLASMARLSLAEQVSQADVDRLVQLLDTLRQIVQDAYNQFVSDNNISIQYYNEQKERIQKNIVRLEKSQAALEDQIVDLNGVIATQTAISQAASNKKQRNQKLLDDATALCGTFQSEYDVASTGRRQELVVLAELERLVERRRAEKSG
ncbi:hypothetical protein pb186bvf_003413 [Paramecium bursaria]